MERYQKTGSWSASAYINQQGRPTRDLRLVSRVSKAVKTGGGREENKRNGD